MKQYVKPFVLADLVSKVTATPSSDFAKLEELFKKQGVASQVVIYSPDNWSRRQHFHKQLRNKKH